MSEVLYEYKAQGRMMASLVFLVLAIAMVLLGMNFGAPIYWYIPIGFALLIVSWYFMSNPNHGCKLTAERLQVWSNKDIRKFDFRDIDHVEVVDWTDGPSDFVIHHKSAPPEAISHLCIGDSIAFRSALEKAGITVAEEHNG